MYSYIKGVIEEIESDAITIEAANIGYRVFTASPYSFKIGDSIKIYLYQNVKEDEISLYGFRSIEEKNLFLKLISVKGVGCKMALPFLASNEVNSIVDAIDTDNVNYLKKFPKVGDKVARQIILDLKGKLVNNKTETSKISDELIEALQALGYKTNDIKKIIPQIKEEELEAQIKEALKLLLK